MSIPENCKYTKDHEWIKIEGDVAIIGVTDFAQSELGEIVFTELPSVGKRVASGGAFCVLESTKAASDVYAPIDGEVAEINEAVKNDPTLVNKDPHNAGWLAKLKNFETSQISQLMDAGAYSKHIGK